MKQDKLTYKKPDKSLRKLAGLYHLTEAYFAQLAEDAPTLALSKAYQVNEHYCEEIGQILTELSSQPLSQSPTSQQRINESIVQLTCGIQTVYK